jgi:hypothetical protein
VGGYIFYKYFWSIFEFNVKGFRINIITPELHIRILHLCRRNVKKGV